MEDQTEHAKACHQRWMTRRNRRQGDPDYRDEWYAQQCGACLYLIRLQGSLADDYGACSNANSPFDGRVMFEHDGCDSFERDED